VLVSPVILGSLVEVKDQTVLCRTDPLVLLTAAVSCPGRITELSFGYWKLLTYRLIDDSHRFALKLRQST
jgi:hypothetical protein